jgi:hypothetical protein
VVITGRVGRIPASRALAYRITDVTGAQIGAGTIALAGAAGESGSFVASISFAEPPGGGNIRAEIFDQDPQGGGAVASVEMFVAPPQAITFTSPPPGTLVGSPVVVTGRVARLPFQSNLLYRVINAQGAAIGNGVFRIEGQPGRPADFTASLTFNLPIDGGPIQIELVDQNADTGSVAASAILNVQVAPVSQAIAIDTPPPGTTVGSPVVITGRTTRYPSQGRLGYRIVDSGNVQLGAGTFAVSGSPGRSTTFNASLTFTLPQNGGNVRVELFDQDATSGAILARQSIELRVDPQPVRIIIDEPQPEATVTTPLAIRGRTTTFPAGGGLDYRLTDGSGAVLAQGSFAVRLTPTGGAFDVEIPFNPRAQSPLTLELRERDPATGAIVSSVQVRVVIIQPR